MREALIEAVGNYPYWRKHFIREAYSKALDAYKDRYAEAFLQEISLATEEGLPMLAELYIDDLQAIWMSHKFWRRTAVKMDYKEMLLYYAIPMLLDLEDPLCARLAELIRDTWAARWPKEAFEIADRDRILLGFRGPLGALGF